MSDEPVYLGPIEIDFHRFGVRIPKDLYKMIKDMAWENRTSVNIQIIDMLFYSSFRSVQGLMKAGSWKTEDTKTIKKEMERVGDPCDSLVNVIPELVSIYNKYLDWKAKKQHQL